MVFYGYSPPDRSLISIDTQTRRLAAVMTPEGLVAHDMVGYEGTLYVLQDLGSLERPDRFALYERLPTAGFRRHGVIHGLAMSSPSSGAPQPVIGGVRLAVDPDGTVRVVDTRNGHSVTVIENGRGVPLERQWIREDPTHSARRRPVGILETDYRNEGTRTYLDCFLAGQLMGSFEVTPLERGSYPTNGTVFHPVMNGETIEIWSVTAGENGVAFRKHVIGG